MAEEIPSVTVEDFAAVAELAEETPVEVVAEVFDVVEDAVEEKNFIPAEDAPVAEPVVEVEVEVEVVPEPEPEPVVVVVEETKPVVEPAANPSRTRYTGGIAAARSSRRP